MAGVNIIPIATYAENGFALPSMEEIIEKITPKTRAKLVEIVKKRTLHSDEDTDL